MKCTFFGHRNTPQEVEISLRETIINLIQYYNVDKFYLGNQGKFDYMALKILKEIKNIYPQITYTVVLAYIPGIRNKSDNADYSNTIYPDYLENTPKKFAISKRNCWLIEHSDAVIVYVKHPIGGAAKFKEIAEKKGKWVINIAN